MASNAFMHVRDMLGGGIAANSDVIARNTTGALNFATAGDAGSIEVQNMVDRVIRDALPRATEFRQLVRRERLASGLVHVWRLNTSFNTSGKFYDEGDAGEPDPTNRIQLYNPAKAYRIDYEVSGLLIAGGDFDVLGREAANALSQAALDEEQAFVNGSDGTSGISGSYPGLLQLMLNNGDHGDSTTIYGVTRAGSATSYVEVAAVDAGTSGTSTGVLDLADLDSAITKAELRKLGGRKIFLCSFERADEINQLLQPQQRFVGSTEIAAGLRVLTYRGFPIVRSKRMAYNGVINAGSGADNGTDLDNSMYFLDMDEIMFKNVAGVDYAHIPIGGVGDSTTATNAGGTSRADAVGGYFKTYGCMSMVRFDCQVIIWNLTAP